MAFRTIRVASIVSGLSTIALLALGINPIQVYRDIAMASFGTWYGVSELVVRAIPLLLTATSVAVAARAGATNVGGEGQLHFGAVFGTWGALAFDSQPFLIWVIVVSICGFAGGAIWGSLAGILRVTGRSSEIVSTLLLNYVSIGIVSLLVFGPWKDPVSSNFPQSRPFVFGPDSLAILGTRIHFGLMLALGALAALFLVQRAARLDSELRAIVSNELAARWTGIPVTQYTFLGLLFGGGVAGLAGMSEVVAIQGRLQNGLSPGYGYHGFLISLLAGHRPPLILVTALGFAALLSSGDTLQLNHGLPFSVVNVLMALILLATLVLR